MRINNEGSTRLVFVSRRVTIKLPRLNIGRVCRDIKEAVVAKDWSWLKYYLTADLGDHQGVRPFMAKGLIENFREFLASFQLGG